MLVSVDVHTLPPFSYSLSACSLLVSGMISTTRGWRCMISGTLTTRGVEVLYRRNNVEY